MKNIKQIFLAIAKMEKNILKNDKRLFFMKYTYMCTFSGASLMMAFFPKILLDICIYNFPDKKQWLFLLVFSLSCCFLAWCNGIMREIARGKIGYLRADYLANAFHKLITSDYKNMEDPTFLNKYDSAFDACANAENGIEKVYNILFDLPALLLKVILFSYILCSFSHIVFWAIMIHIVILFCVKKKSSLFKYQYKEQFSRISRKKRYFNNTTQDFQYGKDIRLYNFNALLSQKHQYEINEYKKLFLKVKKKEIALHLSECIFYLISNLIIYGVLLLKSYSQISLSDITMYFIIVNVLTDSLNLLISCFSDIYGEGLFIVDYFTFLHTDLCHNSGVELNFGMEENIDIQIKNFSFQYPHTDQYIFRNLNLTIGAGEKIALVGDNGIGKSTLIKVLIGLFRDFEGEILLGGKSIKNVSSASLFSMFSVVFQDVNLLSYTVSENVTGQTQCIEEQKVWEAIEKVGLEDKIRQAPQSLHQQVHKYISQEGLEFSGGEAQKMALARAIYKNAKIFILDEPTASLDALAEKDIYEKFGQLTQNKTTIFISHRLASTKFCDRIILLGSDGVLEQGTHQELMQLKGKYFKLFTLQGKYYQEKKNEKNNPIY